MSDYGVVFLTAGGMAITITGKNLRPIVEALKLHTCEFIQEFNPDEFTKPHDQSKPFVSNIAVEIIKGADEYKKTPEHTWWFSP